MANKPTSKPNWVPGDEATRIQEPTGSKKNTGFLEKEKPPFQFFNWLFNIISKWIHYFAGNAQYNIIIDSDSNEGDYTSLAAYIADSPQAGDRVLIKVDEALTSTLVIPDDIELIQLKGKKFTVSSNFSPIIQFGNNVKTKGDLRIENSDTGTIAKGFSINGDSNHHDNLILENKSSGTVTDAVYVEAGKEKNSINGKAVQTSGTITNNLNDGSGNNLNWGIILGETKVSKLRGYDFEPGTKMVFYQSSAPLGWTQYTTEHDKALRVVNSGGGSPGGGSRGLSATTVGSHTLAESQIPSHKHGTNIYNDGVGGSNRDIQWVYDSDNTEIETDDGTGGNGGHDHPLALAYVDVIICTKD